MEVWNGLTPRRTDLSTSKAASHEDYLVIVQKIQELQKFVSDFSDNIQVMPNLEQIISDAKLKIASLVKKIDKVTLPQAVSDKLDLLESTVKEIDRRGDIVQIKRDLETVKEQINLNRIEVLQLQGSFATEVKGFQNKVWGLLEKLQKETNSKLSDLSTKMQHIDVQLDLQASIEKFNKIQNQ